MSMSQPPGAHSKPLSGVRVLDLGWVWAGPMAAAFLADLGAEVIKIEHSERLDNSRLRGAPIVDGKKLRIPGKSIELVPLFHNLNRHKLSARLNIRDERGADLFRQLAAKSDVVLENFTPGTLAALGLDYAALAREHGELIMISLSTAGQFGPIADLRGYAPVISAYSGLEAL
ncbi:MAG TPA: CoA transferase, partial [Rhodocyclaceae bacterium]|nr:CoA transferase [Rhodocyclaceae bacterium]